MVKTKKSLVALLCISVLLLSIVGLGHSASQDYKDTIIIGIHNDITTLDPAGSNTDANMMVFLLTHQTLVDIDPFTEEILPALAQTWEVSEDGCVFTFTIPENVKFSDGTPCTAHDIKYTYERAHLSSFTKPKVELITDMEVLDDTTIRITIEKPNQEFLILLGHKSMSILSESLVEEDEFGYSIGTGMFAVEDWVPGDYISAVRNEHFHGEKPVTRRIVQRLIKEESSRLIALQTGEIDVCVDPLSTDLHHIEADPNLELARIPNVVMLYIAMNNEKPGLNNVHVRRAIAHATDKESCILAGYDGVGTVHHNFINRGQFGLHEGIPVYEYSIEKAKEELAKSGYKPGELSFDVIYNDAQKENMALVIQNDLAKVGIKLNLIKMETAAQKGILNDPALNYELALYQWTDADGTDFTVRNMYGSYELDGKLVKMGSNRGNIKDPTLNAMMDAAVVELDRDVREQMYFEIEEYLYEVCPIVPIATSMINIGIKKGITGAVWTPTAKHDYRYIALPLN